MNIEARSEPVHRNKFLEGLTNTEKQLFLDAGFVRIFPEGSSLFYQDEPADYFYMLRCGKVRLVQTNSAGQQVILHHSQANEGVGIIAVLSHIPYPATAEVIEACEVLGWDGDTARKLMEQIPRLALNSLDMLVRRFGVMQMRFRELATERVERRVARTLIRLYRDVGSAGNNGDLQINMPLSRQDVAEMTGTTLYTVSRILSQWEKEGLVSSRRNQITLHKPQLLDCIAEGFS